MGLSQRGRVEWSLRKAREYLESAGDNLAAGRCYPAAEDIFRSVESSLTALLYNEGIASIEYRDWSGTLTGRLAHQSLVREYLYRRGIISGVEYQTYLNLVSDLHHEGYRPGKVFDAGVLVGYSEFAENLLVKVRGVALGE